MAVRGDVRQRMIESAGALFRERGVHGTSFADVLAHSGAPRGSVYHHFKGGKTELVQETLQWSGEQIVTAAQRRLAETDPLTAIDAFCADWTGLLISTQFAAGCSLVAAVHDAQHTPDARDIAGTTFARWEQVIGSGLEGHGIEQARAASLATILVAALEGAVVLCRAAQSLEPLERVRQELRTLVAAALPADGASRAGTSPAAS